MHPLTRYQSKACRSWMRVSAMLLICMANGCSADTATAPAAASTRPVLPLGVAEIKFDSAAFTIKDKPFTLEIADTDAKTQRGLMYRNAMAADHGMVFVFPTPSTAGFWMKNTYIPLDIIFLDKDGKVLVIHRRMPRDETGMGPDTPAQYVIELNAGTAEKIGLKPGDVIDVKKFLKTAPGSTEK